MKRFAGSGPVHFISDGLELTPVEYCELLQRLTKSQRRIADEYCRGGIVERLEKTMAKALGKELCIYMPTGTLANHIALRLLTGRGKRVIVQHDSHLYNDAGDCTQLSGLTLVPLAPGKATFTLPDAAAQHQQALAGRVAVAVGAVSIESPVRRLRGTAFDIEEMRAVSAWARVNHIGLHLDGARLFLASPYTGVPVSEYAALFDTVYVSLYKYFNAHAGAILAGPYSLLADLHHQRRMFGGSPYQVWDNAAVALHYLNGFAASFAKAVAASEILLKRLAELPNCQVERVAGGTNIVLLHVSGPHSRRLHLRVKRAKLVLSPPITQQADVATYRLVINESLLRRPIEETITGFVQAIDCRSR